MHRKIMLGTSAVAGLLLLAACNRETVSDNTPANNPPDQTAQTEPAPGSKNETVSAAKDAVAGAVGTISAELTSSTKGFIDAAATSDMYEVQASQIALMRAKAADVKKFAHDMIDAHTMTSSQLKSILAKDAPNYTVPTQLDSRHEGMLDNLKGAKDQDLDGRYIAQQINAHEEALIVMRGYAKDGDNPDIQAFAADTMPKVQMHLDMIKDIDRAHRAANAQARNSGGTTTR